MTDVKKRLMVMWFDDDSVVATVEKFAEDEYMHWDRFAERSMQDGGVIALAQINDMFQLEYSWRREVPVTGTGFVLVESEPSPWSQAKGTWDDMRRARR